MPFKSEAQRKKFQAMVAEGKITKATYEEWEKESPPELPERITKKGAAKSASPSRIKKRFGQ